MIKSALFLKNKSICSRFCDVQGDIMNISQYLQDADRFWGCLWGMVYIRSIEMLMPVSTVDATILYTDCLNRITETVKQECWTLWSSQLWIQCEPELPTFATFIWHNLGLTFEILANKIFLSSVNFVRFCITVTKLVIRRMGYIQHYTYLHGIQCYTEHYRVPGGTQSYMHLFSNLLRLLIFCFSTSYTIR